VDGLVVNPLLRAPAVCWCALDNGGVDSSIRFRIIGQVLKDFPNPVAAQREKPLVGVLPVAKRSGTSRHERMKEFPDHRLANRRLTSSLMRPNRAGTAWQKTLHPRKLIGAQSVRFIASPLKGRLL